MLEIVIRFRSPCDTLRTLALEHVITPEEAKTLKGLMGGFYFDTTRTPIEILQNFYDKGFTNADFESFEFLPPRK